MSVSGAGSAQRAGWSVAKVFLALLAAVAALATALYLAFQVSPWPSALFYRYLMDQGGAAASSALELHVPAGISMKFDERYDPNDRDALLDVYNPSAIATGGKALTTIVWIHGGGFISGTKDHVGNYAKILAADGFTVVAVDYALAPGARYPVPLWQVNQALTFLVDNAQRLRIDPSRIVLAGDSAGAQIAAQTAAIIADPAYAKAVGIVPAIPRKQLVGVMLHCGLYDARLLRLEGPFAGLLQSVGWSYFGTKDFLKHPSLAQFSVVDHVTADFPPTFISAGNADPLLRHSLAMADAIAAKGVRVERLFFANDHQPPLGHEYQFNLDNEAGALALERALKFLKSLAP
jgi:acetyl esterase/lipase